MTACQNEETEWHNKPLPTAEAGTLVLYDSLLSVYGKDSVFALSLTVLPGWEKEETRYVNEADLEWRGQTIQGLPHSQDPYFFYDSLRAANGCDSVYVLRLYVSDIPITYGYYEAVICATRITKPIIATTDTSKPKIARASRPPVKASGMANMTMNGDSRDWNCATMMR